MAIEDAQHQVLEYLKKKGQTNTFRLARELRIDRHKLLNVVKELQEKQAIELKYGNVRFLKFPKEERKARIEVKKALSAPKIKAEHKAKTSTKKIAMHQEKLKLLGSLQYENKELKDRLSELEAGIKRQHYTKSKNLTDRKSVV